MSEYKPPFRITNAIINDVAEISNLMGQITASNKLSTSPTLRRTNRIHTIHSSLAIEANTLTLEQVTDVINGKRIIAPPKDIAEVKNAYEIYDRMESINPYSIDDLLMSHGIMMRGLVSEYGVFRTKPVAVVDRKGNILHIGTLPQFVPDNMMQLIDWCKNSDLHILIRSCVFHYEFELIHPFADGNGRIGRLWHTLLLSKYNPLFAWIPVESIVYERQQEYYDAINQSNIDGQSTIFIEFMLSSIKTSLIESLKVSDEVTDKDAVRIKQIELYLKNHRYIKNADVRAICNVSPATANRILSKLATEGKLIKYHEGKQWAYKLP